MSDGLWVPEGTLTLPFDVLETLHEGVSEVRVYRNTRTGGRQVGKRVSVFGREDTAAVTEASLLADIDHPNVARIYVVSEVAGSVSPLLAEIELIMPYYPRGSVLDAINRGERFSVGESRDLMVRLLRGLSHIHVVHGVLHRDLKPANFFLADDSSVVKLGDFGEAMRGSSGQTEAPSTPQFWTPPEALAAGVYDVRSEVYAMGISMIELLQGPFPYAEYTREQLGERLLANKPALLPRHLRLDPQVPSQLKRVIGTAMKVDPAGRYTSANLMTQALLQADFVDWQPAVIADDGSVSYVGQYNDSELRVRTRRLRGNAWRARGEKRFPSGWRLAPGTKEATELTAIQAASTVLRQIDKHRARL